MNRPPLVAIVGRPNVGKSTLFNLLTGATRALVSPVPGTTRDRLEADVDLGGATVRLADTGGWGAGDELGDLVSAAVEKLLEHADVVLLLVACGEPARDGDLRLASRLKRLGANVLAVCNKCDREEDDLMVWEHARLGYGAPVPISARRERNLPELRARILAAAGPVEEVAEPGTEGRCIMLGQPNVGKSSLFNAMLGEERSLVHDQPGTTRDPVVAAGELAGRRWELVDTAGVAHHWRKDETLLKEAQAKSLASLRDADVCLLVLDVTEPLVRQDLRLSEAAVDLGLAFAVALNKCDLLESERVAALRDEAAAYLQKRFPNVGRFPLLLTSATTGESVAELKEVVRSLRVARRTNLSRAALAEVAHSWPSSGKPWRIKQIDTAPPTFKVVPPAGLKLGERFVMNRLRAAFGLHGVPLVVKVAGGRE